MIRTLAILAALALGCGTAQAQRWHDGDWRSIAVGIEDLDLSTRAGVVELDRRIERAVNRICDHDRACRDMAWASSYEQVQAAIARDQWMRRLAAERAAEIRACGWAGCRGPAPASYPPPPAMVTVVTVTNCPPPAPSRVLVWRQ